MYGGAHEAETQPARLYRQYPFLYAAPVSLRAEPSLVPLIPVVIRYHLLNIPALRHSTYIRAARSMNCRADREPGEFYRSQGHRLR